jgi:hypothetical protein
VGDRLHGLGKLVSKSEVVEVVGGSVLPRFRKGLEVAPLLRERLGFCVP